MPEKVPAYRIDENLLREKLQAYRVEIDPAKCDALEQEISTIRFKKTLQLPKINLRIVIPALLLMGLATLVIVKFDSIAGMFSSDQDEPSVKQQVTTPETKPTNTIATSVETTHTSTVSTPAVPTPSVSALPPVQKPIEGKPEITAREKKPDSAVQESTAKKAAPVMAQPPSDTAVKENEPKQDTSVQKSEPPVKKKKRRRRNRDMDELKESTLKPSSAEDDVVVPQ